MTLGFVRARRTVRSRIDREVASQRRPSPPMVCGRLAERLFSSTRIREVFGLSTPVVDASTQRVRGYAVMVAVAVGVPSHVLGLMVAVAGWNLPRLLSARDRRRRDARVADQLLLVVELLAVSARAGSTIPGALAAVAASTDGSVGTALAQVTRELDRGTRLDPTLVWLADALGEPARSLISVLRSAHLDGDPLAPALERLAVSVRQDLRRRAETEARQLSVRMLLPLVCCILPAFALVSVVPVLVNSLQALPR